MASSSNGSLSDHVRQVRDRVGWARSLAMNWDDHRATAPKIRRVKARAELARRYRDRTVGRPDLSRAVGARQRTEPLYSVVPYKEAFSPNLVRTVLDHREITSGRLLDPFAGAGTSLLVAVERGMTAVGVDVIPFSAFASRTLVNLADTDWDAVDEALEEILTHPASRRGRFPDFPVRSWAFTPAALAELSDLHRAITQLSSDAGRDVLRLALLCSVEAVSQATKDGTSLRRRPHGSRHGRFGEQRSKSDVRNEFADRLDLLRKATDGATRPKQGTAVLTGDARDLARVLHGRKPFDVAVFSPPYPNRYDYVANYQLELGFGFVDTADDLKSLRREQLRSHLEAPRCDERKLEHPALDEFLAAFLASAHVGTERTRVYRMICGYFEDMSAVFEGLKSTLKIGGSAAVVVGTQVFGGEPLPTDLLLADIAASQGFTTEAIWVARSKGMSVQQRLSGAKPASSRESILLLSG
jgi:hypothetical protein